jgi:hypothetical protein
MKKSYNKPETQLVIINSKSSFLESLGINGGAGSNDKVATAMDSNSSSFEEDDSWSVSSNKSLWDD